jgi:cation diffusion facilitator CzcD-associated flavoprotein CzcO
MQFIKLNHRVIEARWDELISRWRIKVEDIENANVIDDECDVLLSCTGILKSVHQILLRLASHTHHPPSG